MLLHRRLAVSALSRHADVYICQECGTDEALRDVIDEVLPLREWYGITCGRVVEIPEAAYSRSNYDGGRWWTEWVFGDIKPVASDLAQEIDLFTEALFQMPEFKNLGTMKRLCADTAQPTGDPTEFNLYAQTEHFHIWLRLITRFKDYNLYCHFYQKEAVDGAEH